MDTPATPSDDELRAYRAGRLALSRFEAVDRWLASLPPEEQERLLAGDEQPPALVAAAPVLDAGGGAACFTPEGGARSRFRGGPCIGSGGMGIVESVFDATLGREVALKRCRPRRVDEDLALYATRLRVFRREAQVTAQLEHPGIVPVHDVGTGPHGEPAFTMKRLDGEPMTALVERRRAGEAADVAQVVELLLRIAEAVAYAHRRGVVHRDLKPDNVIVGALGAAYVIDWGLAGRIGAEPMEAERTPVVGTRSEHGLGTPAWMAPEQFRGAAAEARMDVFALGGLLMAALTGYGPRDRVVVPEGGKLRADDLDLSPLDARSLPRGLVAVARRCLSLPPGERYKDGAAVAAELRRWLSIGLTSAERAGPLTRAWAVVRRSPRIGSAVAAGALALIILVIGFVGMASHEKKRREVERQAAADKLKRIETDALKLLADFDGKTREEKEAQLDKLRGWIDELDEMVDDFPELTQAAVDEKRLDAARVDLERRRAIDIQIDQLHEHERNYRIVGAWPSEATEIGFALHALGLKLTPGSLAQDAEVVRGLRARADVLRALAQMQRAQLLGSPVEDPLDDYLPDLIAAAAPDSAWKSLAEILRQHPSDSDHELSLPQGAEADAALASPATVDVVLENFAPDPRLTAVALKRIDQHLSSDADYFWPRVVAARAAFNASLYEDAHQYQDAENHALVALGIVRDSLWPRLILAYIALIREDWKGIDQYLDPFIAEDKNPQHLEVNALKAASLGMQGHRDQAVEMLKRSANLGQLRYHVLLRTRHPLDRVAQVLQEAKVPIPAETPVLRSAAEAAEHPSAPPKPKPDARADAEKPKPDAKAAVGETKPTTAPVEATRPTDAKPVPAKPADAAKPDDEAKPADAKPAPAKPVETARPSPDATKPAEAARPAETKPAEAKPSEAPKPVDAKPAETAKPQPAKPADAGKPADGARPPSEPKPAPADAKPAPAAPAEAKPAEAKPAPAKPAAEAPKADDAAKPTDAPKPADAKPAEAQKPAATPGD